MLASEKRWKHFFKNGVIRFPCSPSLAFTAPASRLPRDILKATRDPGEKHSAATYLGSYGYAPALDDLLKTFKETPDASLRGTVREKFQYFTDSDRVTRALTNIMENAKDEGLRKDCQTALELVALKAEWRRKYGTKTVTNGGR
jgi:hypothetical protein